VKLLTKFLVALLAALAVYSARRRIMFALKTGAVVYIVVLFARLALDMRGVADRLDDFIWPVCILAVVWVILWKISTFYAERRAARKASNASGAARRAR
jgi:hypothetical protein